MQGAFDPGPATHRSSRLWPDRPPHGNSQVLILACSGGRGPRRTKGISSQNGREKGLALPSLETVTTGIPRKPIICGWTVLHAVRCPLIVPTQASSVAWRCTLVPGVAAPWETEAPDRVGWLQSSTVSPWLREMKAQRDRITLLTE